MKVTCVCERCGKAFERWPHEAKGRVWCSQSCHMKTLNAEMNPTRCYGRRTRRAHTERKETERKETAGGRDRQRQSLLNRGEGKSYRKYYGRHEHRVVAEQMLGRPLRAGEIVHHLNGDKRDNRPENLRVYESQADHAREHFNGSGNPRSHAVVCLDTGQAFETIHLAAAETGCNEKAISSVCLGKRGKTNGLRWAYAEEVML